MSVQDYMSALKLGKREYNACVNKGKYPYLPVMESMMDEEQIDSEVSLGIDQIPLRLVVGTCTAGRTNAFADNWMPILEWGSEFSAKWASLSDSQGCTLVVTSNAGHLLSNLCRTIRTV